MDIRKIKKLIELLEESGIEELEICEGEESVRISRGSRHPAAPAHYYAAPQAPAPAPLARSGGGAAWRRCLSACCGRRSAYFRPHPFEGSSDSLLHRSFVRRLRVKLVLCRLPCLGRRRWAGNGLLGCHLKPL